MSWDRVLLGEHAVNCPGPICPTAYCLVVACLPAERAINLFHGWTRRETHHEVSGPGATFERRHGWRVNARTQKKRPLNNWH
eukprot:3463604-Pyramimonas_sp.AAC.1